MSNYPSFGVPVQCRWSHTGQLRFVELLRSVGATSVRAGCRQVVEALAIVANVHSFWGSVIDFVVDVEEPLR